MWFPFVINCIPPNVHRTRLLDMRIAENGRRIPVGRRYFLPVRDTMGIGLSFRGENPLAWSALADAFRWADASFFQSEMSWALVSPFVVKIFSLGPLWHHPTTTTHRQSGCALRQSRMVISSLHDAIVFPSG
jgi:hypothetical protein